MEIAADRTHNTGLNPQGAKEVSKTERIEKEIQRKLEKRNRHQAPPVANDLQKSELYRTEAKLKQLKKSILNEKLAARRRLPYYH